MIKKHNIYVLFLLAIGLVLNSTQLPQLHAASDLEIAEMVTACGYLPATIIELATENKSEKVQLRGKIAADALRFAHTTLATINHTDDWRTNKYHLVWAAIHGYSLVNNIHKLSNYQELLAPAPTTGKAFAQKPISQTKNYKEKAANAARIILSLCKTACALVTANGGIPLDTYLHDHITYQIIDVTTYSKAISSSLLSITECLDQCIVEKNSYKKGGWFAAFLANAYLTKQEWRNFSDEHELKVNPERERLREAERQRKADRLEREQRQREQQEEQRRRQEEEFEELFRNLFGARNRNNQPPRPPAPAGTTIADLAILELPANTADAATVKRARNQLALRFHSDKNNIGTDPQKAAAEERMKQINAAYDRLKVRFGIN